MNKQIADTEKSIQINNGLTQTCADGASLAFDVKYGIMFCAYMPGYHGDYGESRGKIALSYFPASQPANVRHIDIAEGDDVYVPNILSLGEGRVRVFYERHSRKDGDHPICYKDFDYRTNTLGEEKIVMLKKGNETVPLGLSHTFEYLDANGYKDHVYVPTEQIIFGGGTLFYGEDGYVYGSVTSELSEAVLYRSDDNLATVEFFAIYPHQVQYEFDYKFLDGKIYAIYRTNHEKDATSYAYSEDMGKTWSEPYDFPESIQCRPRMIVSAGRVIMVYNYYDNETGNRPDMIMGRCAIRVATVGENDIPETLGYMQTKYGIVNIAICDVCGDVYMAYSTSELALEYQNGTPWVRGKDAVRYLRLDL